jgi:3-hydroxymyristoyl/3-hydroxydecanoyl-(acyl carrier protein) dehydratase
MPIRLDAEALKAHLPHRSFNLIPDEVVLSDDGVTAESFTRVPAGDPRGRVVFARKDGAGQPMWSEPFLAELLALTGVPLLTPTLKLQNQTAVFSMISKLTMSSQVPMHGNLHGMAKITRNRNGFTSFSTWLDCDGVRILEAEVMSGAAALAEVAGFPARPFHGQLPRTPVDPARFAWKPRFLRFIDDVVHVEAESHKVVFAYTYPANHPFVPGHFPEAALMMGVTQWSAVADAAWAAAQILGIPGGVIASGTIKRQDGGDVMDVRELVLEPDAGGVPRIASTKRIAFREPVRPGDGVLIEVTVAPTVL